MTKYPKPCRYCGRPAKPNSGFCSKKCEQAYREYWMGKKK